MQARASIGLLLFLMSASLAGAQPSLHEKSRLLGQPLSIFQKSEAKNGIEPGTQTLKQETHAELLGNPVPILQVGATASEATSGIETGLPGEGATSPENVTVRDHEFYIGGVRVWNGKFRFEQGALMYSGGVAPTQIAVPLFVYPLGPVLLRVEAGVEFEGLVNAKLAGGPSYPLTDSTLHADLTADLYAAGYLEAYARLLFVKAGLGGRLTVIDSSAGFQSVFYLNGMEPRISHYGYATLLSGQVYGFVDFKLFLGRWSRLLGHTFFNWRGKVFYLGPRMDSIEW